MQSIYQETSCIVLAILQLCFETCGRNLCFMSSANITLSSTCQSAFHDAAHIDLSCPQSRLAPCLGLDGYCSFSSRRGPACEH